MPLARVRNPRSLIYVENLADAIVRCGDRRCRRQEYGSSDGTAVSTPRALRALGAALGRPARLFPFPAALLDWFRRCGALTRSLEVDDSAIRHELGWHPPYTFEQGLRATAEWYLAQGR